MENSLIMTIVLSCLGSAGLWSLITLLIQRKFKKDDDSDLIKKALKGLLYTDCLGWGDKYIEQGWISIDDYNDFRRYHYEPYKALGGNSAVDRVETTLKALPSRPTQHE
jgi:hypothetical protein